MGRQTRRVILVEDQEEVRTSLKLALEREQFEVQAFADGAPALERADFPAADLMITDLAMPTPGDQVIREVRRRGHDLPIVVLSGALESGDETRLEQAGASAVLRKPIRFAELASVVAALLPSRSAMDVEPAGQ